MKKHTQILMGIGCLALLIVSWVIAICSKSTAEKQLDLIQRATALMADGVYILAEPMLEEAAGYSATHTLAAEEELKHVYLKLINNRGSSRKYTELLKKQMERRGARPDVFDEAANYYLSISRIPDALAVLREGIEKTGDEALIAQYENNRYAYKTSRTAYDYVAAISGQCVQVKSDGLWGLARADGTALIDCEYEKISTFLVDRAVVMKNGEVYAIDSNNNRVAKLHDSASDFGNLADDRIPILLSDGWHRATGYFEIGTNTFQQLGMYSGGYAAAKTGGKWGVVDLSTKWLIPVEYDGIIQDELGRCYARGAVFARLGGMVYLFVEGKQTGSIYDDARPFSDEGFAAVKRNGKWGFIDITGTQVIDFLYDDALSFGQHLAAVKIGELWGYISLSGRVVIEPIFLEAKSFYTGTAPVLTERGWQFITLYEYAG